MAGDPDKSALEQLAEILLNHGVEFIVVGGQAEVPATLLLPESPVN